VLLSHLAEVKERITHSSQTRIDTHIGTLGYILERHLLIKTHINHFALWSRQKSIEECVEIARESIDSGKALATFKKFVEINS
jgi:thymidine phosphorylase